MDKQVKQGIWRLLMMQLGIAGVIALGFGLMANMIAAYSALLGGAIVFATTAVFARIALRYEGARQARQIVWSFYWAEAVKWLVAFALFVLVFKFFTISAGAFFVTFIVVQLFSFWVAPWWLKF